MIVPGSFFNIYSSVNLIDVTCKLYDGTIHYNGENTYNDECYWITPDEPGNSCDLYNAMTTHNGTRSYRDDCDWVAAIECDEFGINVVLLMHMNDYGEFTDVKDNIVTVVGTPFITGTQSKFDGLSGYFNGTTDYLSFASDAFTLASGNWCYENFVRLDASANKHILLSKWVNGADPVGNVLPIKMSVKEYLVVPATGPTEATYQVWGLQPFKSGTMANGWAAGSNVTFTMRSVYSSDWLPGITVSCDDYDGTLGAILYPLLTAIIGRADIMELVWPQMEYASGRPSYIKLTSLVSGRTPFVYQTSTTAPGTEMAVQTLLLGEDYNEFGNAQEFNLWINAVPVQTTIEEDWTFTVTLNSSVLQYVTTALDDFESLRDALISLVNSSAEPVTASSLGFGSNFCGVNIKHDLPNVPFTCTFTGTYESLTGTSPIKGLQLGIDSTNKPFIEVSSDGTTSTVITADNGVSDNVWSHLAYVKEGTTYSIYADGVLAEQATGPSTINMPTGYEWNIGSVHAADTAEYLKGYLDEVRLTVGNARYTEPFGIPTKAFFDTACEVTTYLPLLIAALVQGESLGDRAKYNITSPDAVMSYVLLTDPGSYGTTGVLPTKTMAINTVKYYNLKIYCAANMGDSVEGDLEFLNASGDVVCAVRYMKSEYYQYKVDTNYGPSLESLVTVTETSQNLMAWGKYSFEEDKLVYLSDGEVYPYTLSFNVMCAALTITAVRVSNVMVSSSYPGGGAFFILEDESTSFVI